VDRSACIIPIQNRNDSCVGFVFGPLSGYVCFFRRPIYAAQSSLLCGIEITRRLPTCLKRMLQWLMWGAFSLVLTACGASGIPAEVSEGKVFPEIILTGVDGSTKSLKSLRGKLVVVNLWATWCHPCRNEMPSLERLSQAVDPRKIAVVAISVDTDKNLVQEFILQYRLTFPIYMDQGMTIANRQLGVQAFPTTYLVGPDGRLVSKIAGERDWSAPEAMRLVQDAYRRASPGQ